MNRNLPDKPDTYMSKIPAGRRPPAGKIYIMEKLTYEQGKRSFSRESLPYALNLARVLAADTTPGSRGQKPYVLS